MPGMTELEKKLQRRRLSIEDSIASQEAKSQQPNVKSDNDVVPRLSFPKPTKEQESSAPAVSASFASGWPPRKAVLSASEPKGMVSQFGSGAAPMSKAGETCHMLRRSPQKSSSRDEEPTGNGRGTTLDALAQAQPSVPLPAAVKVNHIKALQSDKSKNDAGDRLVQATTALQSGSITWRTWALAQVDKAARQVLHLPLVPTVVEPAQEIIATFTPNFVAEAASSIVAEMHACTEAAAVYDEPQQLAEAAAGKNEDAVEKALAYAEAALQRGRPSRRVQAMAVAANAVQLVAWLGKEMSDMASAKVSEVTSEMNRSAETAAVFANANGTAVKNLVPVKAA